MPHTKPNVSPIIRLAASSCIVRKAATDEKARLDESGRALPSVLTNQTPRGVRWSGLVLEAQADAEEPANGVVQLGAADVGSHRAQDRRALVEQVVDRPVDLQLARALAEDIVARVQVQVDYARE